MHNSNPLNEATAATLRTEISKRPRFKNLKREAIEEIIKDALDDFYLGTKEWLKAPSLKTYKSPIEIGLAKAEEIYLRNKYEQKTVSYDEQIPMNAWPAHDSDCGSSSELLRDLNSCLPPTPEDRKINNAIKEMEAGHIAWKEMGDRIRESLGDKMVEEFERLDELWEQHFIEHSTAILLQYSKARSIYEIAQEKKVNPRKLLYILRKINFPMRRSTIGRRGNYISYSNLSLLDEIFPELQKIWEQEENYKKWIRFFKKEFNWNKSRISKYISRAIATGKVPRAFFEVTHPPRSIKAMIPIPRNNRRLSIKLKKLGVEEGATQTAATSKNRIDRLKQKCFSCKTLLEQACSQHEGN